jgi:RsiW-degrading membrane proteinase PrsW (M82 family)
MVVLMELLLLIGFAFLPPVIYVIWIRNMEKKARERWGPIFLCFLWGASIAVVASLILEIALSISVSLTFTDVSMGGLVIAILIAPFAEELTKPLALRLKTVKHELDELEDGLIYGAVAGLGFSATENLFYGWDFLSEGLLYFIVLISIRSFGACLLHAAATAMTGYGYGRMLINKTSILVVIPYFFIAICMHAFYNFLVSISVYGVGFGFIAAMVLVVFSIRWVRKKIHLLDRG